MKFVIIPGRQLIVFEDNKPGSHATLFSPNGQRLKFRDDASSFSDSPPSYAWAFEGTVNEGDRIVFATSDREVLGIVRAGNTVDAQVLSSGQVLHIEDKPSTLTGDLLPTIDQILKPPHPEMPLRPVPMRRHVTDEPVPHAVPAPEMPKAPQGHWAHVGGLIVRSPRGTFRALSHEEAAFIALACNEYQRKLSG